MRGQKGPKPDLPSGFALRTTVGGANPPSPEMRLTCTKFDQSLKERIGAGKG